LDYGEAAGEEGGGWRRGTFVQGKSIKAYRTDGTVEIVAIWIPKTGTWMTTRAGRDYYEHNKVQFIVHVPCVGCRYDERRRLYINVTVNG
jgi:hypothetical protein